MAPIVRLSESQIRYLTDVDHTDHEALMAIDEESGVAVGVARFVRLGEGSDVAEAAVIVVDPWQGAGLGKALSVMLAERARELGIARFEATLLMENRAMMGLLESLGPVRTVGREGSAVVVTLELPRRRDRRRHGRRAARRGHRQRGGRPRDGRAGPAGD